MSDPIGDALRRAAGVRVVLETRERPKPGDVGIGRGGGSAPRQVRDDFGTRFNADLRASFGYLRGRVSLDDLLNS